VSKAGKELANFHEDHDAFIHSRLAAAVILCVSTANGQCGETQGISVTCGGPNGCSQTVAVNSFYETEFGGKLSYFMVWCCESHIPSYYPTGEGGCPYEVLNKPTVRKELDELASTSTILVANCAGQFEPYRNRPIKEWLFDSKPKKILN